MARLTAAKRRNVPKSKTGVPSKATKKGGAVSGSYPMPDITHARDALARSAGKPVAAQVRAKAYRLYPQLKKNAAKRSK